MDMDKLRMKLTEKKVPTGIIIFLEECLRPKETVEMTL